jgi:type I restriction enzyme M protein
MITGELKSKVDKLWTTFWNNGISNPLSVIEQISYLLFIKRLDDLEQAKEKKAQRLNRPVKNPTFTGQPAAHPLVPLQESGRLGGDAADHPG